MSTAMDVPDDGFDFAKHGSDAVEKYRGTHTNYIGRGRARFLAGDAGGARADLTKAEEMYPFDPVIERLKLQIDEGTPSAPASAFRAPPKKPLAKGTMTFR